MPRRPARTTRWTTAATWPVGVLLTAWDYLWRVTALHRAETTCAAPHADSELLTYPAELDRDEVQGHDRGHGALFHRRYAARIVDADLAPEAVMKRLRNNLNRPAPTTLARFHKVLGPEGEMCVGDEYVVRMPGPWDGPVRVVHVSPRSFRFATLDGHLEAGQIEFRVARVGKGDVRFEIESWARSSSWLSDLLYDRFKIAKEVQAHMWISFIEGVARLAGGRLNGGITIQTERAEDVTHAAT